jgi:hypothetical protein
MKTLVCDSGDPNLVFIGVLRLRSGFTMATPPGLSIPSEPSCLLNVLCLRGGGCDIEAASSNFDNNDIG